MARETLDAVMNRLLMLIRSGYPVIYIVSHEETRVLDYLSRILRVINQPGENPTKRLVRWYEGIGLQVLQPVPAVVPDADGRIDWLRVEGGNAWAALPGGESAGGCLEAVRNAAPANHPLLSDSMVVYFDLHPYLHDDSNLTPGGSQVRGVRNTADALRRYYDANRTVVGQRYKTLVIVAPTAQALSMELERDIIQVEFPLPETPELALELDRKVAAGLLQFPQGTAEDHDRLRGMIAGAGCGLTLDDYRRGLSMFAVRGGQLTAAHVEDMLGLKAKAVNNRALEYTPHVEVKLGGLEVVKEWVRLRRDAAVDAQVRAEYRLPALKGVMLGGVSGGGKSQLARAIASEFNMALLRLDVGSLFGSYVGESEERTRSALRLAEVLAPVVLWIDEVDKAFSGIGGGGDNGVSARVFGAFLTWLAEKDDSVFVVCTANNFTELHAKFPEFTRKGRFDELFWVPLPDASARQEIFQIYLQQHYEDGYLQVDAGSVEELYLQSNVPPRPDLPLFERLCNLLAQHGVSTNLTGAEIEHCISEALLVSYDRRNGGPAAFNAGLVYECVKQASARALYGPGTDDTAALTALQAAAAKQGWIFAGEGVPAGVPA